MIEEEDMLFKLYVKMKVSVESDLGCSVACCVAYSSTWRIFGHPSRHGAICVCGKPSNTPGHTIYPLPLYIEV